MSDNRCDLLVFDEPLKFSCIETTHITCRGSYFRSKCIASSHSFAQWQEVYTFVHTFEKAAAGEQTSEAPSQKLHTSISVSMLS